MTFQTPKRTAVRTVVADKSVAHFCQIACSIVAILVLVLGTQKLVGLELNEAQLFLAMTGTLSLTGVFIITGFLCRAWRKGA